MKITKALLAVMLFLVFLNSACDNDINIKQKSIAYYRHDKNISNTFINIKLKLNDFPRNITTIYVENIVFTFKNGWAPPEKYLSGVFNNQIGNPKRFIFHRPNFDTVDWFDLYVQNAMLNVDEWIKRGSCPFEKIQLQGISADAEVRLPEKLEISFPCDLDAVRICLGWDDFLGQCVKYAP